MSAASIALTIAGSDSGGGAGIQADLKTFSALGVFGASVITAITAQNTCAVTAVHEVPADIVAAQCEAVLSDLNLGAIKIGMLFSPEIIDVVSSVLETTDISVVLDPVMIAKSGDALLQPEAVAALIAKLLPRADLLTPNAPEAAAILGVPEAKNALEMEEQAKALLNLGAKAVLIKGGHVAGEICTDYLVMEGEQSRVFATKRIETKNTHGTGCTLSAAIAAGLAKGLPLVEAVTQAHGYLHEAIKQADGLGIGAGKGPVHHFHAQWHDA